MQFLRRFSLAIGSSGDDTKFQETPGKSGGLVSMQAGSRREPGRRPGSSGDQTGSQAGDWTARLGCLSKGSGGGQAGGCGSIMPI